MRVRGRERGEEIGRAREGEQEWKKEGEQKRERKKEGKQKIERGQEIGRAKERERERGRARESEQEWKRGSEIIIFSIFSLFWILETCSTQTSSAFKSPVLYMESTTRTLLPPSGQQAKLQHAELGGL